MKKISIIIPAYNEEKRIARTVAAYHAFYSDLRNNHEFDFELVLALNGCTDNTLAVVQQLKQQLDNIIILDLKQAGKGLAIQAGFADALTRHNDLIGFVDADMATSPSAFYDLVLNIKNADGIIASRYMPGARVYPPRPWIKRWGSWLTYESIVFILFGLRYYDLQCGAKLFTRKAIATITPHLMIRQWAFDVELLYLCKKFGLHIIEVPTVWYDQEHSKLTLRAGMHMLGSLFKLRFRHSKFGSYL